MHTSLIGLIVTGSYDVVEGEFPDYTYRYEPVTGTVVGMIDTRVYVMQEDGIIRNCEVNDLKVHDPKEYARRINREIADNNTNDGAE